MKEHFLYGAILAGLVFSSCQTTNKHRSAAAHATDDAVAKSNYRHTAYEMKDGLPHKAFAAAVLESKSGSNAAGNVWFEKTDRGVKIVVKVTNVNPGLHGIHIHEKGNCSAPDASSAGEHFNPAKLSHGSPNPSKHHLGDLGNITINKDGTGTLLLELPAADSALAGTWDEIVGKSIVLHGKRDDLVTQPAGDSGDRIACGVIIGY